MDVRPRHYTFMKPHIISRLYLPSFSDRATLYFDVVVTLFSVFSPSAMLDSGSSTCSVQEDTRGLRANANYTGFPEKCDVLLISDDL